MLLSEALQIPNGITAVVGGGGKTSLIDALARELSARGKVLIYTTTHIMRPREHLTMIEPLPAHIRAAFAQQQVIVAGMECADGRLGAFPPLERHLSSLADYVLVEADGAKRLPVKAPAAHEPVLPADTRLVIAVAGLDALGRRIADAAFRAPLYASLLRKSIDSVITADDIATVLMHPQGQMKNVKCAAAYVLNKADDQQRQTAAAVIAARLDAPAAVTVLAGQPRLISLWRDSKCLF
ncbi:MAG: selenium cofactor biosynthesis protein YqeC [Bacillota bacterium]|nr:selenium cofactor biosynthesis protein YqeC [Bacillota bacterium]